MFYTFINNTIVAHPDSPTVFGAPHGVIPTAAEIEQFAGYVWCDTEEQAVEYFNTIQDA